MENNNENGNGNNEVINNLTRLKMELRGFSNIPDNELEVYLMEADLNDNDIYDPASKSNLKKIYQTALSVLESIANNPETMKNYKMEDISITHMHTNISNRIDHLNRKIRMMPSDDDYVEGAGATISYLFSE